MCSRSKVCKRCLSNISMILSISYTLLKINEPWYTDVLFLYETVPVSQLSNDNVLWIVCRQCRRSTANRAQPLAVSEGEMDRHLILRTKEQDHPPLPPDVPVRRLKRCLRRHGFEGSLYIPHEMDFPQRLPTQSLLTSIISFLNRKYGIK